MIVREKVSIPLRFFSSRYILSLARPAKAGRSPFHPKPRHLGRLRSRLVIDKLERARRATRGRGGGGEWEHLATARRAEIFRRAFSAALALIRTRFTNGKRSRRQIARGSLSLYHRADIASDSVVRSSDHRLLLVA